MEIPAGIQAVADHGALYASIGQRRLQERLDAELGDFVLDGVELRPTDLALDGAGIVSALADSPATNHRAALLGLARHAGFGVREDPGTLEIADDRGSSVTARLDEQGRLTGLSMSLVGSS